MPNPKLFFSYSWTNPDHEAWVLRLAMELRDSGVDVILDKWDLKEGHDAYVFMEKMVSDPDIKKVVLICDKLYAEKTDNRSGGVGAEAQIISGEIYAKEAQDKFVAIVTERDEDGKAYLPTYYKSRIYIDLSDPSAYSQNFERLLRWVYDRPLHEKPEFGETPGFLSETDSRASLATTFRFKRALEAVRNVRPNALPAAVEYLNQLATEFERLRIDQAAVPFDDAVVKSIEDFLHYRNEAIDLFLAFALYQDSLETRVALHRFFEQLIPYLTRPSHITSYRKWDFDNFKFIVHELFLYAVACFIRHERFESAAYLLGNEYYVLGNSDYGRDVMVSFAVFRSYMESLEYRNKRLKLCQFSVHANLLEQRCKGIGIEFRHLMQADFILFLRDHLDRPDAMNPWWPETLLYAERHSGAFELFARSKSAAYFERAKSVLGIESKKDLVPLLKLFADNPQRIPRWNFNSFSPVNLLGFNEISTKP